MKWAVIVLIVFSVLLGCKSDEPKENEKKEYYTDQYDDFDVQEVLKNKRLFNNHLGCFRTGKNCTPLAQKVRDLMPEVIQSECARCTPTQLQKGREVADYILENHPDIFLEFENKHDPQRIYRKKYAERLKKEGIVLPD